MRNQYANA